MVLLKIVYDNIHKLHSDPQGRHPESPWRLATALSALQVSNVWSLAEVVKTPEARVEVLEKAHDSDYIEFVRGESRAGFHYIDDDTYVTEHTFEVGARFATAAYDAAIRSLEDREHWLIMPRPGGHHAGFRGLAMGAPTLGFCIFNYAAIAARALESRGLKVLVLDFDAHHGNGTQDILWDNPRVVHVDVHQEAVYPGTGDVDDIGGPGAEGTKINIPLPAFSGDPQYVWFTYKILDPLVEVFKPGAIIVSAGFDAYQGDPLTALRATRIAYAHIAYILRNLWVKNRVKTLITNLEGGYGDGLKFGLREYVEVLLDVKEPEVGAEYREPPKRITERLYDILKKYWDINI